MRELAILTFVSLDGVMQAPRMPDEDPSGGFTKGGWANPCWDDVMENVADVAMASPYDVLLGRNTYDAFANAFNGTDSPLDRANKYVVTSRTLSDSWPPTTAITRDIPDAIAALKKESAPLLQVHGSHRLIQLLMEHQLIDEYRIWTFPVVLGEGKRLFGTGSLPSNLELKQSKALSSGATMSVYRHSQQMVA